ncbi:hypothetical protein FOZ63_021142 [Perkinsus olseni]|uniref:Uncharacterized protein n=1 Tax=Perkinsus olseni TaxID=32597 RepID=A0A7J6TLV8_PEROL|nr:hypothetical protein FOZ63_021142 [Perkinsus olseni]
MSSPMPPGGSPTPPGYQSGGPPPPPTDYAASGAIVEQIQLSIRDAVARWTANSGGEGIPVGVLETDPAVGTMLARLGMRLQRFVQVHCPNDYRVSMDGRVSLATSVGGGAAAASSMTYQQQQQQQQQQQMQQMGGGVQQQQHHGAGGLPSPAPSGLVQPGPYAARRAAGGPYRPAVAPAMLAAPYSPLAHHRKGGKGAMGPMTMSPSFHAAAAAAAAAAGFGSPLGGLPQSALGAVRAGMAPWAAAAAAAAAQHMHMGMFPMNAAHPGAPPEPPEPPLFVRVSPSAAESPVRALQSALAHLSGIPRSSKTMAALLELVAEENQSTDRSGNPISSDVAGIIESHPAVRKTVESILLPLVHFQLQQAGHAVPPAPATAIDLVKVLKGVDGGGGTGGGEKLPPLPRIKLGGKDKAFIQFVQAATLIKNASGGAMLQDRDAYEMIRAVVESRDVGRQQPDSWDATDKYRHHRRR